MTCHILSQTRQPPPLLSGYGLISSLRCTRGVVPAVRQNAARLCRTWLDSCFQMGRDREFQSTLGKLGSRWLWGGLSVLGMKCSSRSQGVFLQKPIRIPQGPVCPHVIAASLPLRYSSSRSPPTISPHSQSPDRHLQMRTQGRGRDPCPRRWLRAGQGRGEAGVRVTPGPCLSFTTHLAPFQSESEGRQPPGSQERSREPPSRPCIHWRQRHKRSLGRRQAVNYVTPSTHSAIQGIVPEKQGACLCEWGSVINHRTPQYLWMRLRTPTQSQDHLLVP